VRPDWTFSCHPNSTSFFRDYLETPELSDELDGFIEHAAEGMTLLDIGSHYGLFTLAALHYGGPDAQVVAVDPSRGVKRIFEANLQLAGVKNRVCFIEAAMGAQEGFLNMLSTDAAGEEMFIPSQKRSDSISIPMVTISKVVEGMSRSPAHLKIDVEGYEEEVIKGGLPFIAEKRPIIFLELHGEMMRASGKSPLAVLRMLTGLGYQLQEGGRKIDAEDAASKDLYRLICKVEPGP
jgi:FkbM family methyltransferase